MPPNPFNSQDARRYSNYNALDNTPYKTDSEFGDSPQHNFNEHIARKLNTFIINKNHPCIMARSAFRSGSCRFGVYPELGSINATAGLSRDLISFLHERSKIPGAYASFMAVFQAPKSMSEAVFEEKLWQQLNLLHQAAKPFYSWDTTTSSNPVDSKFSFSFGGKAFYIVGMHPNSSRKARRFEYPMLVFNLHEQFEALRNEGIYEKVKSVVRRNDKRLQGTVNPMLKDFGDASEARQYSGRSVADNWKCPFLS
ncbi:guanitoxin biosynthesis heme-dependent pre-guanitoxin N-hydroxylase GntA [Cesiribacter sp. SM1]|uniref:guanitoxin biosynthesis heme-dependent pre-guanitoxin N-hydroxylase GntA n=1 Tax=Cesiribacter sp. SM1 TaxID=2861196 RepID=UPI001CD3193B|nr:guanitoxin biosynthesis heme-dependent pre-guanitoxin N-hydroxylase GntA [Cesiribacter sp. SM1]